MLKGYTGWQRAGSSVYSAGNSLLRTSAPLHSKRRAAYLGAGSKLARKTEEAGARVQALASMQRMDAFAFFSLLIKGTMNSPILESEKET